MKPHTLDALRAFVGPYYAARDAMHDISHASRILETARALAGDEPDLDEDLLVFGAYLHGIVGRDEAAARDFLAGLGLESPRVDRIIQAARESQKEAEPVTREGAVLHDAHLTEGGPAFTVIRALLTGREAGQSVAETADFLRSHVLGRYHCVTPAGQTWYAENERYVRYFLNRLAPAFARREGEPAADEGPDPYDDEPTVDLICPWCNEEVDPPACLAGNDVLCPECLEVIYLTPGLVSGGIARAVKSDAETFPHLPRCPRCRSRAVWRPPVWALGLLLILAAMAWFSIRSPNAPWDSSPGPAGVVGLALGLAGLGLVVHRPARRCSACGHRWR